MIVKLSTFILISLILVSCKPEANVKPRSAEPANMTSSNSTCSSFTYSDYGACQANNMQSRTVTSSSPTGCTGGSPVLSQSCTYTAPVIAPSECFIAAAPAGTTMLTTGSKTLTVTCTKGTPPFNYGWYKNESLQSGITSNAIQLSSLAAGTYAYNKVVVSNPQGAVTLTAFTVTVTGAVNATPGGSGIICNGVTMPGTVIEINTNLPVGTFPRATYMSASVDTVYSFKVTVPIGSALESFSAASIS